MSQPVETKISGISFNQDIAKKAQKGDSITITEEENGALLYKSIHGELGYVPKDLKDKVKPFLESDYKAEISKVVPWKNNGVEQISLRVTISAADNIEIQPPPRPPVRRNAISE